ncbi:uncharacterized protein JCM6883_005059 [Sporobolomyces salmoneus]|uniref:uncharacterized protein n=1 Tax=Sporobolomyces salmoneus TaxID=183962 RepID=UPI00317B60C0
MDYATQIQQLESLLPLISSTRSSLPSLVSSLSPSTPSPHLDLSTLYRLASTQCEASIKTLVDRVQAIEKTLDQAEQSFRKESNGVVVREKKEKDPFERVGEILGGSQGVGAKEKRQFQPKLKAPKTREQLEEFLKTWETNQSNVKLRPQPRQGQEEDVESVEMTLKGVMKVVLILKWEESDLVMVEFAACSSLKENNPVYRPSRFSLFQELTNSVMSLIDKSLSRPGERVSNLEEALTFLSNPPLPF